MNKFERFSNLDHFDPYSFNNRTFVSDENEDSSYFFDEIVMSKEDEKALKDALKDQGKLVGLANMNTNRTMTNDEEFVAFTKKDDKFYFFRFVPEYNVVIDKQGPFFSFESAKSRADCYGLFESLLSDESRRNFAE